MIEESIMTAFGVDGYFEQVYPFEIPDSANRDLSSITYMRIGSRIDTRYYASETMKYQLESSRFICSISNPKYLVMIKDFNKLQGHIANFQDQETLQMEIESYDDFKSNTGEFVREFTLNILHKTILT